MKLLFRRSIYGYTAVLLVKALSMLISTASDNFVHKQRGSFNDYCVRCLVNSLDVCCRPRTLALDCSSVWGSAKAQMECNSRQQKPITIQKAYMWCSIQLEIKLLALSELVQLFLFHFLVCFVVCSLLITLTRGPRKFTSKVNSVSMNAKWR